MVRDDAPDARSHRREFAPTSASGDTSAYPSISVRLAVYPDGPPATVPGPCAPTGVHAIATQVSVPLVGDAARACILTEPASAGRLGSRLYRYEALTRNVHVEVGLIPRELHPADAIALSFAAQVAAAQIAMVDRLAPR